MTSNFDFINIIINLNDSVHTIWYVRQIPKVKHKSQSYGDLDNANENAMWYTINVQLFKEKKILGLCICIKYIKSNKKKLEATAYPIIN